MFAGLIRAITANDHDAADHFTHCLTLNIVTSTGGINDVGYSFV